MDKEIHLITGLLESEKDGHVFDHYDMLQHYSNIESKTFIGENNNCRFCGTTDPKDFLNDIAHTFPEFTGNKLLFSNDECKNCNQKFGKFDSELAIHGINMRTFIGIKGKKKYPKIKSDTYELGWKNQTLVAKIDTSNSKDSNIDTHKHGSFHIDFKLDNTGIMPKEDIKVKYEFPEKFYSPLLAYKSLMKIALAIMPESELQQSDFSKFKSFLSIEKKELPDEIYSPFFEIFHYQLPIGKRLPSASIWKKKDKSTTKLNLPTYFVLFGYGFYTYQIFLPFIENDKQLLRLKELHYCLIPMFALKEDKSGIEFNLIPAYTEENKSNKKTAHNNS